MSGSAEDKVAEGAYQAQGDHLEIHLKHHRPL